MTAVTFVTGSAQKAAHFSRLMKHAIDHQKLELDELQTVDHQELVEHKVRQAYAKLQRPVLVEDVSLVIHAWGALPGPFIKFFLAEPNGPERICSMLDGFDSRRATASCTFGYFDGQRLELISGQIDGVITDAPRGDDGYGFDLIFEPDGYHGKTAAELTADEYDSYYTTIKPFAKIKQLLDTL